MKFCAYMAICLSLPLVLLAEDEKTDAAEAAPDADASSSEVVADPGFERFKTILDRMPFGRPPPGFNPDAPNGPGGGGAGQEGAADAAAVEASEVEQQILSSVRVSVLNVTPAGKVVVGFTDSSVQPARNYLLEMGEKRENCDWQVVSADAEKREVRLSKGGVEATLKLGGGVASSDEKKKEGEGGERPMVRPGLLRGRQHPMALGPGAHASGGGKMSGLEIARMRRKERLERQLADEEQQRQAAEQAKKEREQEAEARKQAAEERKQLAEERKAQLDQLMQIQEELRRQREEKEQERRAAEAQETVQE